MDGCQFSEGIDLEKDESAQKCYNRRWYLPGLWHLKGDSGYGWIMVLTSCFWYIYKYSIVVKYLLIF